MIIVEFTKGLLPSPVIVSQRLQSWVRYPFTALQQTPHGSGRNLERSKERERGGHRLLLLGQLGIGEGFMVDSWTWTVSYLSCCAPPPGGPA